VARGVLYNERFDGGVGSAAHAHPSFCAYTYASGVGTRAAVKWSTHGSLGPVGVFLNSRQCTTQDVKATKGWAAFLAGCVAEGVPASPKRETMCVAAHEIDRQPFDSTWWGVCKG
jgi:hypothetical protein